MLVFFTIVSVVCESIFLAAIGRFAWRNREKKLVFWGWVAVIGMFLALDGIFFLGRLK